MKKWECLLLGIAAGMLILFVIAMLNTRPCPKCDNSCGDNANYCSVCGQQLRIIKEE